MRRIAAVPLLLLAAALPGLGKSTAAPTPITPTPTPITAFNGYCFVGPSNTLVTCPVTPQPTRLPISPNKAISILSLPQVEPGVDEYSVGITSSFLCFALDEPILVSTLGSPEAAALSLLSPAGSPSRSSSAVVHVSPDTGTANLVLEVSKDVLTPAGVTLKAVWPVEGVERLAVVVPPTMQIKSTPVGSATAPPALPTTTPVGTTPVPTNTPVPAPFTVAACVQPDVLSGQTLGGQNATLYGLTTPGASCLPSVNYSNGGGSYFAPSQTAGSDGLVIFPFTESSTGSWGIATVTCSYNGQQLTACTGFLIAQTGTQNLLQLSESQRKAQIRPIEEQYCPANSIVNDVASNIP